MDSVYHFRIGKLIFILDLQYSSIGYCYPRLFISWGDSSYSNLDFYLQNFFSMTEDDFMSWLDGTQKSLDTIEEVRAVFELINVNWDELQSILFAISDERED